MTNPFTASAKRALDSGNRALWYRIMTEGKIARKLIKTAIDAGYVVSVSDGEEWTVKRSSKVTECVNACFSTDMDRIAIRDQQGNLLVSVLLVYGNEGYDVIADYGWKEGREKEVAEFMKPIMAYADTFEV